MNVIEASFSKTADTLTAPDQHPESTVTRPERFKNKGVRNEFSGQTQFRHRIFPAAKREDRLHRE